MTARTRHDARRAVYSASKPENSRTQVQFLGRCSVSGKRMYGSKDSAKRVNRTGRLGKTVYRCPSCQNWELGTSGDFDRAAHRAIHANDPTVLDLALTYLEGTTP